MYQFEKFLIFKILGNFNLKNVLRAVVAKNQAGQKVTFSDHQVS